MKKLKFGLRFGKKNAEPKRKATPVTKPKESNAITPVKSPSSVSAHVAKRWTQKLVKDGFTPISNFFLENYHQLNPPITSSEAMFIVHLMWFKRDENPPYPSYSTIAKRMGVSDEAVRTHARKLQSVGYLRREMQKGERNKFHLTPLFTALESIMRKAVVPPPSTT